jgi:hypothetical protein
LSSTKEPDRKWRYIVAVDKNSVRAAVTRGPKGGKLKNLHYDTAGWKKA